MSDLDDLVDHVVESGLPAVVLHEPGQIDAPEGWVLVKTEYVGGKRVRTFDLPKEK